VAISNVCQVLWVAFAGNTTQPHILGAILGAQALYGILQIALDSGTAFEGARLAARGDLTDDRRAALVRSRLLLASVAICFGGAIMTVGGSELLEAGAPYALALVAFALLNVWEPYGHGRLVPYAAYLSLRSAVLVFGAGTLLVLGRTLPLWLPGVLELVAVVVVALGTQRTLPGLRALRHAAAAPWRAITTIGVPALVSQYTTSAGTVFLSVGGHTSSAATLGVGMRVLTGLHGVNGALAVGAFPRIAGGRTRGAEDRWFVDLLTQAVVGLSLVCLGATILLAPALAELLLPGASQAGVARTMVICVSAAGFAAIALLFSYVLIARGLERLMLSVSIVGALVVTIGALTSIVAGVDASAVAAYGFLLGELVMGVWLSVRLLRVGGVSSTAVRRALIGCAAGLVGVALAMVTPDARAVAAVFPGGFGAMLLLASTLVFRRGAPTADSVSRVRTT
jgi:hypothetical protein